MSWSITLGNIAGTAVRVHLTFLLLLAWIAISAGLRSGAEAALANLIFILLLFACVLLHEFGHILMARRFGIPTPDVTLLPIGGVASLERMPEKPSEQLLVAIAGPAVNVVIALVLVVIFGVSLDSASLTRGLTDIDDPRHGLLARLAAANIFLVVFNLIPAYPMDGGRMLNALLAMPLGKRRAMRISVRIGQGLALLMGFLGLFGNPMLIFIAIFVYLGAAGESAQSELEDMAGTLAVRDAMESDFVFVPANASLGEAVDILLATGQHDFPVVDEMRMPVGFLTREALIGALRDQPREAPVRTIMDPATSTLRAGDSLRNALGEMGRLGVKSLGVADQNGALIGLLTMSNVGEMMMIRSAQPDWRFGRHRP